MRMTAVDDRLAELEERRIDPGLSVAEQNELRDCEITLGMIEAPPRARAEAARRVERFAAERAAKKTRSHHATKKSPAQLQREINEVLAKKRRSHATKKNDSEILVARMIGRRVKSGWHGLVDGEIVQWEPFGAGLTDVLVREHASGRESWHASHSLTPIDGEGPLPSRSEVRKIREAEMEDSMKKIGERWAKEPKPPRIRR